MDTLAENKALFRRFVELWNRGDAEGMARCWSPSLTHHGRFASMPRADVAALMAEFMAAFPDLRFTVEDLVAEGDLIMARMTASATHLGDFRDVAASGRRIQVTVMGQVRISDGLIVEHWNVMDELHFMQQLGIGPSGLLDPQPA